MLLQNKFNKRGCLNTAFFFCLFLYFYHFKIREKNMGFYREKLKKVIIEIAFSFLIS